MFEREYRRWVALVTAVAFLWVFQAPAFSGSGDSRLDSPGIGNHGGATATEDDAAGAVEKISPARTKANQKHFPWLLVAAGAVVVGVAAYFLFIQKSEYMLTVNQGPGVTGTPPTGESRHKKGTGVSYSFALAEDYQNLSVTLDGVSAPSSGTVNMNADHVLAASAENTLQLEWLLDGNAQDTSGWNRHGTVFNATLCADHLGVADKAYFFDGATAYIEGPSFIAQQNNCVSLSIWVNAPEDLPSLKRFLWANGFLLGQEYSAICFAINVPSTSSAYAQIPLNTWVHIVGTFDGSAIRTYLNGVLTYTQSHPGTPSHPNYKFTLGMKDSQYWKGKIDDVRVYNYKLSDAEIQALARM